MFGEYCLFYFGLLKLATLVESMQADKNDFLPEFYAKLAYWILVEG